MSESEATPTPPSAAPETPTGGLDDTQSPAPEASDAPVVETTVTKRGKPTPGNWWWGLGRRKASVARVRIRPGDGKFIVNKKPYEAYFPGERDRKDLINVLETTSTHGKVDIIVNVKGGGTTGQTGAIILGLGRAIMNYDPSLEPILRDKNFLTRDPRKVERKKYGQPGARKRFQFSKR